MAAPHAQAFAALIAGFGAGGEQDTIDAMNFGPASTTWSF
jgi:hypothetical protein